MTCTDFLSQLTDYFDGHISPELLEEVRTHTASCHTARWSSTPRARPSPSTATMSSTSSPPEFRERLHTAIMAKCNPCK